MFVDVVFVASIKLFPNVSEMLAIVSPARSDDIPTTSIFPAVVEALKASDRTVDVAGIARYLFVLWTRCVPSVIAALDVTVIGT
jgi:hypothetical protein